MPTRQTSSSGRPKSPRIQVVLPEDLCDRLAVLADLEARTVSNMARVLIQQGVERLEQLHGLEPDASATEAPMELSQAARPGPQALPRAERARRGIASPTSNPRTTPASDSQRLGSGASRDASSGSERSNRGMAPGERLGAASPGGPAPRGTPIRGNNRQGASRIGADGLGPDQFRADAFQDEAFQDEAFESDAFEPDQFRAKLERQGRKPAPRLQKPRRLRIWRPS